MSGRPSLEGCDFFLRAGLESALDIQSYESKLILLGGEWLRCFIGSFPYKKTIQLLGIPQVMKTAWWWMVAMNFIFPYIGFLSSSQLTKSIIFSEGWPKHQPAIGFYSGKFLGNRWRSGRMQPGFPASMQHGSVGTAPTQPPIATNRAIEQWRTSMVTSQESFWHKKWHLCILCPLLDMVFLTIPQSRFCHKSFLLFPHAE